jgi:hypothetical protein
MKKVVDLPLLTQKLWRILLGDNVSRAMLFFGKVLFEIVPINCLAFGCFITWAKRVNVVLGDA